MQNIIYFFCAIFIFFLLGYYDINLYLKANRFTTHFLKHLPSFLKFLVIAVCSWSIFTENDLKPHYLLGLSYYQAKVLIGVSASYAYDLGAHLVYGQLSTPVLYHHYLGLTGCGYMIFCENGGGMMMRLLLDIVTEIAEAHREDLNDKYPQYYLGEKLSQFLFFIVRIWWYTTTLMSTVLNFKTYYDEIDIFWYMYLFIYFVI